MDNYYRPKLEKLDQKLLLTTTVMEHHLPNDRQENAQEFSFPENGLIEIRGVSESDDDKDFFKVTADSSGELQINVSSTNNNVPQLEIENQAGKEVFETEPKDGLNGGQVRLQQGITYFFRLRSKEKTASEYSVNLSFNADSNPGDPGGNDGDPGPTPDSSDIVSEVEPNNRQAQALAIDLGEDGVITLTGISEDSDDKDFFKFTAAKSGQLTAAVSAVNGNFAQIEVENANGTNILETEPNDGINSASGIVVAGNQYFVRLRSKNDNAAEYEAKLGLGVEVDIPTPGEQTGDVTEVEPNDTRAQATRFGFDSTGRAQLNGNSIDSADKDFFSFVAPQTGQVSIDVISAGSLAQLQIEDELGNRIFETRPNDGLNSGQVQVEAGKTYFVRLRSRSDGAAAYSTDLLFRQVGDSNGDQVFNTSDLIKIFQAGKYRTGQPASFAEGDWNGDGVFDERDLMLAFQTGNFELK